MDYSRALEVAIRTTPNYQRKDLKSTTAIITSAASEHIGYKDQRRKDWISDGTWETINRRKEVKAAINTAKKRQDKIALRSQYTTLDRDVKRNARKDKRAWTNSLAEEAQEAALNNRTSDLYRLTKKMTNTKINCGKPIKDSNGSLVTAREEQLELWADHYSELLAVRPLNNTNICSCASHNHNLNIPTSTPSTAEVTNAIKGLKNKKSPGSDNISPELLKVNPEISALIIHPLIEEIWNSESVPDELKVGIIVKIPKKGDLTDRNNWRGITLLSMINKVLTHIISSRLSDALTPNLREQQAGFRPNKSCIDHINSLRVIVEQSVEWRSSLYLIFIDFEKAFDTLDHKTIWKALECKGVPEKLIRIIKNLYIGASCRILHDGALSRKIEVGTGVRQGCVLSPLLFNIVLDTVMRQAMTTNRGIVWRVQERLEDLEYADDICLLSHSYTDMALKLQTLAEISSKAGLRINTGKSKAMRINSEVSTPFFLNNEELEDVEQFNYLGTIITQTGGSSADIANRIKKASQAFGQLGSVWKSSAISQRVKISIFNSNVKSTLLYGCETWNAAPKDNQALQVVINKCLRKICRVYWPMKIANNDLWERTNQQPISNEIQKRKWNWIGHTLRKAPSDIARNAIEWNPQGSRRRGRPAHTWRRQIETDAKKMRKSWSEVKNLANNRSEWRKFVTALCSS